MKPDLNDLQQQELRKLIAEHAPMVGLTKREWFAGLAMQGLLANPDLSHKSISVMAELAADQADEMLSRLAK